MSSYFPPLLPLHYDPPTLLPRHFCPATFAPPTFAPPHTYYTRFHIRSTRFTHIRSTRFALLSDKQEVTDDEDEAGESGVSAMQIDDAQIVTPAAALAALASATFDEIVTEARRLNLITESQIDAMTDSVASGESSEAKLADEWRSKVAHAQAEASAGGDGGDDASVASRSLRVVYRPMGESSAAASLQLDSSREIGHRGMSVYYKQRHRPTTSLAAVSLAPHPIVDPPNTPSPPPNLPYPRPTPP